jgi:plasmid stabilization system protein ParE
MYQLILKPNAILMAREAYEWYEDKSEGLGEIFLAELETCIQKIKSEPVLYSKVKKNFRQLSLKRFPYVVVYELIKTEVIVFAIFHTSRNPKDKFKG